MSSEVNAWLTDETFFESIKFKDKPYLKKLFQLVKGYLQTLPVPVMTYWHTDPPAIAFNVGSEKKYISINSNVAPHDYLVLAEYFLDKFFPRYCHQNFIERELTTTEIAQKIKAGSSFEQAIKLRKKEDAFDVGCIDRVYFKKDVFRLLRNGKQEQRITKKPISVFLKELRSEKVNFRKYLFDNSTLITETEEKDNIVVITYSSTMLYHFFKIRFLQLRNKILEKIEDNRVKWGKFIFIFESQFQEEECRNLYRRLENATPKDIRAEIQKTYYM